MIYLWWDKDETFFLWVTSVIRFSQTEAPFYSTVRIERDVVLMINSYFNVLLMVFWGNTTPVVQWFQYELGPFIFFYTFLCHNGRIILDTAIMNNLLSNQRPPKAQQQVRSGSFWASTIGFIPQRMKWSVSRGGNGEGTGQQSSSQEVISVSRIAEMGL